MQKESTEWIIDHGSLNVEEAVVTAAGTLPYKYIIHSWSAEHSVQLRRAVWSASIEADRMELGTEHFNGDFRLSARFGDAGNCPGVGKEKGATTTLHRMVLMHIDEPTVNRGVKALHEEKNQTRWRKTWTSVNNNRL